MNCVTPLHEALRKDRREAGSECFAAVRHAGSESERGGAARGPFAGGHDGKG